MDKIKKALEKLKDKEKQALREILINIESGDFDDLDIKKLKGRDNIFRVRKGSLRVIFYNEEKQIKVLSLERRSDNTYQ